MMILDRLLGNIASQHELNLALQKELQVTFSALIFTYWARQELKLDPGFEPLTGDQVSDLFRKIRKAEKGPPYRLADQEKVFVQTFGGYAGLKRGRQNGLERTPFSSLAGVYGRVCHGEGSGPGPQIREVSSRDDSLKLTAHGNASQAKCCARCLSRPLTCMPEMVVLPRAR